MDSELKIILAKYFLIVILTILYIAFMLIFVAPFIGQFAHAQSAFDTPNQFNNPQYNQYQQQPYGQQYGQQPYQDYNQYQYQQPYMQQPYYGSNYIPQPTNPIQFGTSEIIYTILGGGALGYARYNQQKRNQDRETLKEMMAAQLQTMRDLKETNRVNFQMNEQKANEINDAPNIKLEKQEEKINQFAEKVAKA